MSERLPVGSYLLFSCLYRSQQHSGDLPSIEEYISIEGREVEAACRVAEWLGLVTPDGEGKLGWKPTHLFVEQILQRSKQWTRVTREKDAEPWEDDAVTLICEAAIKDYYKKWLGCDHYIRWFFGYIGLMKITDGGDWIPTRRLLNIAAECRMRQRDMSQDLPA
jgi:hypothetical protein